VIEGDRFVVATGDRIGPFRLEGTLGVGGAGVVYRARHVETGGLAALKVVGPSLEPSIERRFHREARVLNLLDHPNIVHYLGAELSSSPPYLLMNLVEGTGLADVLREAREMTAEGERAFPLESSLKWARGLASGLALAHSHQVVHRDLKPQNVIINTRDEAVLIDFGLARSETTDTQSLTASADMIGTLIYMSPEQFKREGTDARSDVYQWGLLVFEIIHGHLPFSNMDPLSALNRRFSKGVTLGPVPKELERLARSAQLALRPDPATRPTDGAAILAFLDSDLTHPKSLPDPSPGQVRVGALISKDTRDLGRHHEQTRTPGQPRPQKSLTGDTSLPIPAEKVGDYRIVAHLGMGGMGRVLEGRHDRTGERVAIKLIRPELMSNSNAVSRFRAEIDVLLKITSPWIVRTLDHGEGPEGFYLVMEYVPGITLSSHLQSNGPLSLLEALDLITSVAEGIVSLHACGIVHRDLKPTNIMLTPGGGPRVLDLGLALDPAGTRVTQHGGLVGSLPYLPPESLLGQPWTPTGDVYQIGAILYESLTGKREFLSESARAVLEGTLMRDHSLQDATGRLIIRELISLYERATDREVNRRIPNARLFLDEILTIRGRARARATQAGRSRKSSRPASSGGLSTAKGSTPSAPASRIRDRLQSVGTVLVVGLVLVLAGITAWLLPEIIRAGS